MNLLERLQSMKVDTTVSYANTKEYSNGCKYIGKFKSLGKIPHGFGEFMTPDGLQYEGEWVNGEMSGNGKYYFTNGDVWEGSFRKNELHGAGMYSKGGMKEKCIFWKGIRVCAIHEVLHSRICIHINKTWSNATVVAQRITKSSGNEMFQVRLDNDMQRPKWFALELYEFKLLRQDGKYLYAIDKTN